jgi:GxxExxY protein
MLDADQVAAQIVDAALHIHYEIGPGLLESAYRRILAQALLDRGLEVEQEKEVPLVYQGRFYEKVYKLDLLVGGVVVVELKAQEKLAPVHINQLYTYLKLTDMRVGLLINFGALRLKDGIKRVVNRYTPSEHSNLRVNRR